MSTTETQTDSADSATITTTVSATVTDTTTVHTVTSDAAHPHIKPLFLRQNGENQPQNVLTEFVNFINGATKSLHIAIYDFRLDDPLRDPILTALKQKATAGVEVKIAYDLGKPAREQESSDDSDYSWYEVGGDPAPAGTQEFLESAFVSGTGVGDTAGTTTTVGTPPGSTTTLESAPGINAAFDGTTVEVKGIKAFPQLMHNKFMVRDVHTQEAALWMGSANFTNDAWTLQENNILQFTNVPELASFYETDFQEMWTQGSIESTGTNDEAQTVVDGVLVEVDFSPGDGPTIDQMIANHINQATQRVKIASMVITSRTVLGAIADAIAHQQVPVSGVFDATQMEKVVEQWGKGGSHGGHSSHSHPKSTESADVSDEAVSAEESHRRGQHNQHGGSSQGGATHSGGKTSGHGGGTELWLAIKDTLVGKHSTPYSPTSVHDFMHNKVVVCDDTVVTGSFNFSRNATRNGENVLVLHDKTLADAYVAYIDSLIAHFSEKADS